MKRSDDAQTDANTRKIKMDSDNPFSPPAAAIEVSSVVENVDFTGLAGTRTGLTIVYYSICIILLTAILGVLAMVVSGPAFPLVGAIVAVCGFFGGSLGILIGQLYCLGVPQESGAKGLIRTAVFLQASCIAISVGSQLIGLVAPGNGMVLLQVVSLLGSMVNLILGLASFLCFLRFLKKLAIHMRRRDLSKSASTVLKLVIVVVAIYLVFVAVLVTRFGFALGKPPVVGPLAMGLAGLLLVLMFLVALIRYANLVIYLARAIRITKGVTP